MGKIESRTGKLVHEDKKVFDFISDFTNFNQLIPQDKIGNWHANPDECSFTVSGLGKAGMRIIEREPNKLIKVVSDESTPIRFTMWIQLKSTEPGITRVRIIIDPDVNMALMLMVKKPLEQFADSLIDQMEKFSF